MTRCLITELQSFMYILARIFLCLPYMTATMIQYIAKKLQELQRSSHERCSNLMRKISNSLYYCEKLSPSSTLFNICLTLALIIMMRVIRIGFLDRDQVYDCCYMS